MDFYCHKYKLVIEVDGSIHEIEEVKIRDKEREIELKNYNLNIIRFTNKEVSRNLHSVLNKIQQYLNEISDIEK